MHYFWKTTPVPTVENQWAKVQGSPTEDTLMKLRVLRWREVSCFLFEQMNSPSSERDLSAVLSFSPIFPTSQAPDEINEAADGDGLESDFSRFVFYVFG